MNWPAIRSAIEQIHLYLTNFQTQFSRKRIIKKNVIPFFELPFLFFFFFLRPESFPTRYTLRCICTNSGIGWFFGERDEISNNRIASRSRHILTT